MNKINPIFVILLLCIFFSCREVKYNADIELALKHAGQNRKNLENVLYHYQNDSLKFEAASFLIKNMDTHFFYKIPQSDKYDLIYSYIDSLKRFVGSIDRKNIEYIKAQKTDIMFNRLFRYPQKEKDIELITKDYLIENIDQAFDAWFKSPVHDRTSFQDFCEFVLPYRVLDEPVEYWRQYLRFLIYNEINSSQDYELQEYIALVDLLSESNFFDVISDLDSIFGPTNTNVSTILKSHFGDCKIRSCLAVFMLRSLGIPTAFDFIPHWGNRAQKHYWYRILASNYPNYLIDNENRQNPILASVIESAACQTVAPPQFGELPSTLYVQYCKTIPKVFRKTFSTNPNCPAILFKNKDIPNIFTDSHMIDVTKEYLDCADAKIILDNSNLKDNVIYLCIFDRFIWEPVQWAKIENNSNTVIFRDMGKNICYFPMYFKNKKYIPAGKPFILTSNGEVQIINPNVNEQQSITLLRKYPLFVNNLKWAQNMVGGQIQGSNDSDFKEYEIFYEITSPPFHITDIKIECSKPYRFYRYAGPNDIRFNDLAELEFYYNDSGKEVPLQGSLISALNSDSNSIKQVFDKNWGTYFSSSWIGIDLGENNRQIVTKVRFGPRSDTNMIFPDNMYELFYWNDHWVSLGRKVAKEKYLSYTNVPKGALFWLRNLTTGKEERIFTYDCANDRQIWW